MLNNMASGTNDSGSRAGDALPEQSGRSLPELRDAIDVIDAAIVGLLAKRLDVCREVAEVKQGSNSSVIQPNRVREVLASRRQWAIDSGIDADFVEGLFRVLLAETHRIETAAGTEKPAPEKSSGSTERSALDTVATGIDHVVVVVPDLVSASKLFAALGFVLEPTEDAGVIIATAGGATIALIAPNGDEAVEAHLATHGAGVSRVVIEVLNTPYAQGEFATADPSLITDLHSDDDGHEQFLAVLDPATGTQLGFISRTGHRVRLTGASVRGMFHAPFSL